MVIHKDNDDDHVVVHDKESNSLFTEFGPAVNETTTWDPLELMNRKKRMHSWTTTLNVIPNCPAMEHQNLTKKLKSKGNDAFFGQEKHCLTFKKSS